LLELEWYTEEVIVSYLVCEECGKQGCHVEENREQEVISKKKLEELKWCGYMRKQRMTRRVRKHSKRGM